MTNKHKKNKRCRVSKNNQDQENSQQEVDNNDQEEIDQDELDRLEENNIHRVDSLDEFVIGDNEYEYNDDNTNKHHKNKFKDSDLNDTEKDEYEKIQKELDEEIPTIQKIMNSNITKADKKTCLKLFEQFHNSDSCSTEYYRLIDSINEILLKSKMYTKEEIQFLEDEEEKLRQVFVSNDTLKTKILKLEADATIKSRLLSMYEEMMTYPTDSSNHNALREEIEWSIRLPYQKREVDAYVSMDNKSLNKFYCDIRKKLDEELYGMDKVKDKIIQILNDRRSSGDSCARNLCMCGPPGVGKTEICKVLSRVLNKKFAKISAGALDSAAIKGTNRVWTGSEPSIVLQILAKLKTNNPVIAFDEIDKLGDTSQGKLAQHALLHLSDPDDNEEFQDNYLKNFSHDLSKIFFIYIMNNPDCLDEALRDRFDIMEVEEYTNDDKLHIFKNFMLPKALTKIGMNKKDIVVNDAVIKELLTRKNMGLRTVKKIIKDLVGKVNMYRNVLLSDGTTGSLKLDYSIPNFKLPLKVDSKVWECMNM